MGKLPRATSNPVKITIEPASTGRESSTDKSKKVMVKDPVAVLKAVLPAGWIILEVRDGAHPHYRPEGNGTEILLGLEGKEYLKQQYSAALYIMPVDYEDGGADPTNCEVQTRPPRLIATVSNAKLYLWPGPVIDNWRTMQEDLLKALLKGSE